jgi:putative nucleotidyltransferase with HDIG domain
MSATPLQRESAIRLAAFIATKRAAVVASVLEAEADTPDAEAAGAFAGAFLDCLGRELETGDLAPTLDWVKTQAANPTPFEHCRIVILASTLLSAEYVAENGYTEDVMSHLARRAGELERWYRTERIARHEETVASLLSAIRVRDVATFEHSRAVGMWSKRIAKTMGMNAREQSLASLAGTLHDVGKIATPTEILLKPAALDLDEWESMRAHASIGAKILERIPSLEHVAPIVRAHHERTDGRGYPDGLAGNAIPVFARIVAVADSFHAMINERPYREELSVAGAMEELRAKSGTQFDPRVIGAMLEILRPASTTGTGRTARVAPQNS